MLRCSVRLVQGRSSISDHILRFYVGFRMHLESRIISSLDLMGCLDSCNFILWIFLSASFKFQHLIQS